MVGGEIILAGARQAAKALAVDESAKVKLLEAAKDSPHFASAADAYAKRIEVRQRLLLRLFQPLRALAGLRRDYFDNTFQADMAEKLSNIPEEDIVSPKPTIAVPAMNALGYSLEESDLKEMYLSLLATASNAKRVGSAHPSFVEVIKQLSGEEANVLKMLLGNESVLAITARLYINRNDHSKGYRDLKRHVVPLERIPERTPIEIEDLTSWIDNWIRLGLFTATYTSFRMGDDMYSWAENRPEVTRLREEYKDELSEVTCTKGLLERTEYGEKFAAAVSIVDLESKSDSPDEAG